MRPNLKIEIDTIMHVLFVSRPAYFTSTRASLRNVYDPIYNWPWQQHRLAGSFVPAWCPVVQKVAFVDSDSK